MFSKNNATYTIIYCYYFLNSTFFSFYGFVMTKTNIYLYYLIIFSVFINITDYGRVSAGAMSFIPMNTL